MIAPTLLALALSLPAAPTDGWDTFVQTAAREHGDFGRRCAEFLAAHRPAQDAGLDAEFLLRNLRLALEAREAFPWCRDLPEERFLNDVLPYAVLDETREDWRETILPMAREIVADCATSSEAAMALNRNFFNRVNVHYNTGRKKPNQSPSESIEQGRATCTGLSILFVDACRAVGVPARVAGTALWTNKRGNHTWVEVWDQEWMFAGADEPSKKGFNHGWFVSDASKGIADDWRHAIWASSWEKGDDHFPMVWDLENHDVGAENVTARYNALRKDDAAAVVKVHVRVFERAGGERLVVDLELLDATGAVVAAAATKAGTADMNDMATFELAPKHKYVLRMRHGDVERSVELRMKKGDTEVTRDFVWDQLDQGSAAIRMVASWLALLPEERHLSVPGVALTAEEASGVVDMVFEARAEELRTTRDAEHAGSITLGDATMPFESRTFGDAPETGRSLWISMHGGGGAPARVNDQQWRNQIGLYEPAEGIYVAPRAPTDTWNLWHQGHVDDLFDRLIENFVAFEGVDPDRVYLMGYSAGGDGVYQLGPRMADRFAAAAMMAGHPNDASPLGLRNLPFMIFMGGKDAAYKRNEVAAAWGERLAALREADAGGYDHLVTIYEGLGHWMDRRDRAALPWMAARTRDPWPKRVVWRQSPRTHERFYWLATPKGAAVGGAVVRAEVAGQTIALETEGAGALTLRLSDALVDLDRPIVVTRDGTTVFEGTVTRSVDAIFRSILDRADPRSAATAEISLPASP